MEEKRKVKKEGKKLQILVCTLITILVALVAIFGVYTKKQNRMENNIKGYDYAMDLKGARIITLTPSTETKTVIKDSSGNEVEDAENLTDEELTEKGYTKEEININSEDLLTQANYEETKGIIEKRLQGLNVENYIINLNNQTGEITIELPENDQTDNIVNNIATTGKFEIVDSETKELLMDNNDIKSSQVMYGSTSTGTTVYLDIKFNKTGTEKFENITGTYVNNVAENTASSNTDTANQTNAENQTNETSEENQSSENETTDTNSTSEENQTSENETEEAQETAKQVTMSIDDEEMMTTYFDEVIKNGDMPLSIGSTTTDTETLNQYAQNALNIAVVLDNGKLPIEYNVTRNEYVLSDITRNELHYIELGIIIAVAVALLILIIKHKTNGFLASLGYIILSAIYALIIRYANVIISIEGIFGIVVTLIINYIFVWKLLSKIKEYNKDEKLKGIVLNKAIKENYKEIFLKILPICIMSIIFCFINWVPISSFGMTTFWGILLIAIINILVTNNLLKLKNK